MAFNGAGTPLALAGSIFTPVDLARRYQASIIV
jgi:hypothetical protein